MFNTLEQIINGKDIEIISLGNLIVELQHELVEKNKIISDLEDKLDDNWNIMVEAGE